MGRATTQTAETGPETANAAGSEELDEEQEDLDPERYRHTEVDGVEVVKDEPLLSGLAKPSGGNVPIRGTRVLTLKDGRMSYACRDCNFVGTAKMQQGGKEVIGTRGEVRRHRTEKHGEARSGPPRGRRRGGASTGQDELPLEDPALATMPHPAASVLALELGDIIELAEAADQWGRLFESLTSEREAWKVRALVAERELRSIKRAIGKFLPAPEPATAAETDGDGE